MFSGKREKSSQNLSHFENENNFEKKNTFWKWKLIPKPIRAYFPKGFFADNTVLSRKTSFFFLTQPENDLSAKKDNTNGNRILANDKNTGEKLEKAKLC